VCWKGEMKASVHKLKHLRYMYVHTYISRYSAASSLTQTIIKSANGPISFSPDKTERDVQFPRFWPCLWKKTCPRQSLWVTEFHLESTMTWHTNRVTRLGELSPFGRLKYNFGQFCLKIASIALVFEQTFPRK
jgi:hypothetical protein